MSHDSGSLRVSDFDYQLPRELIAQEPAPRRDASRLMTLDRAVGAPDGLRHLHFTDLLSLLRPADLLVVNDTRVIPARLLGKRIAPGTGGKVEALLVRRTQVAGDASPEQAAPSQIWRALLKGACRQGEPIDFGCGLLGRLLSRDADGATLELSAQPGAGALEQVLMLAGRMPTPPYIRRGEDEGEGEADTRQALDRERYQTVYSHEAGALAAPTAGLHFTEELLAAIRARGVEIRALTLHVGLGTFQPVRVEFVQDHRMHPESFEISDRLSTAVARTRKHGGRVVAVGTTTARALEWRAAALEGHVDPGGGECDSFIIPGHRFRVVDALVTNFHLPRSTLLMLVSAFAGRETMLAAYASAIQQRYRFYSYGDAMFIH
jgi:S-adenosylmethionine:tRNA ribosyltransferase-isomerase